MGKKHVGYEIHTLDHMIGRLIASYNSRLHEQEDLTQMQSWIIAYLYDHSDQDIFQKDLESQFHIPRSTATGVLKVLEKKNFIMRLPHPDDARLKRLVLTEKGTSLQLAIIHNFKQIESLLKSHISKENLDIFLDVVTQMQKNIKADPYFPRHSLRDGACDPDKNSEA